MGADGGTAWMHLKKGADSSRLCKLLPWPLLSTSRHGVEWDLVPDNCIAAEYGTHLPFSLLDLSEIIYSVEELTEEQKNMTWEEYALDVYTDPMFNDDYYYRFGTALQELVSYLFLGSGWKYDKPVHEPDFRTYKEEVWFNMNLIEWSEEISLLCYPDSVGHEETWT